MPFYAISHWFAWSVFVCSDLDLHPTKSKEIYITVK